MKIKVVLLLFMLCAIAPPVGSKLSPSYEKVTKPHDPIRGRCSWFRNGAASPINPKLRKDFVAMRWDYKALCDHWGIETTRPNQEAKDRLAKCVVKMVHLDPANGQANIAYAYPSDWGPAPYTGRTIDLCKQTMHKKLKCKTNDFVTATLIDNLPKEKVDELVKNPLTMPLEKYMLLAHAPRTAKVRRVLDMLDRVYR